ncbi:hypothetical protein [Roseateles sp. LYH14W]|uniref:DUF1795 domain-containing protein n=1 Tax=Pelomonas parva TaxID=3299032 RepID=A0ABW7F2S5_9BURK
MAILNYSFSLTAPPAPRPQERQSRAYSEFLLDLAPKWREVPTDEDNSLTFQSDDDGAVIVIAVDFFDIPDDQAQALAEQCVDSRIDAIRAASQAPLQVLLRDVKPRTGGGGLEMSFVADAEGEPVHLYLGYVTARKILSFSMVCQPGRQEAAALFNATVPGFRPRLP